MNEAERYLQQRDIEKVQIAGPQPPQTGTITPPPMPPRNVSAIQKNNVGLFENWWSMEGRINRKSYILSVLLVAAILTGIRIMLAFSGVSGIDGMGDIVLIIIAELILIPQSAKRFQDLGISPGWVAILFIPFISIIARLYLWLTPRNPEATTTGSISKGNNS
jgi:uncharacterized membrane protein YhaH (DUF805 family)